jgi:hypothetical protein
VSGLFANGVAGSQDEQREGKAAPDATCQPAFAKPDDMCGRAVGFDGNVRSHEPSIGAERFGL